MLNAETLRKVLHELLIIQKLNNRDVREIIEFEHKEIVVAVFEYEDKRIKIIAKIRETELTIFEKVIEEKNKFAETLNLAKDIMYQIGRTLL